MAGHMGRPSLSELSEELRLMENNPSSRRIQMGRDRRQRRRRIAAVGAAGVAAKKHHDAKVAGEEEASAAPTGQTEASAAGGLSADSMNRLKELGELHEQNILSDEEFEREKAKLLGPQ
jgi:Short C-terminal domain